MEQRIRRTKGDQQTRLKSAYIHIYVTRTCISLYDNIYENEIADICGYVCMHVMYVETLYANIHEDRNVRTRTNILRDEVGGSGAPSQQKNMAATARHENAQIWSQDCSGEKKTLKQNRYDHTIYIKKHQKKLFETI